MGIRAPRILRGRGNGQRCVDRSEAVLAVGDRRGSRVRRPRAACICRAVSSGDWHRVHRDPAPFHHPVPGAGVILGNTTGVAANIQIVPNAPAVAMAFSPQSFRIPVGGTVTWINKDTMAHTVTSNTTGLFGSSLLTPGASWSHVFAQNGTFYYHCDPHRQMWGVIVVVVS